MAFSEAYNLLTLSGIKALPNQKVQDKSKQIPWWLRDYSDPLVQPPVSLKKILNAHCKIPAYFPSPSAFAVCLLQTTIMIHFSQLVIGAEPPGEVPGGAQRQLRTENVQSCLRLKSASRKSLNS